MPAPELGVCYYPEHWPESQWERDAKHMSEMGLSWVRIDEFAWSRLEPKEGQMQWDWLDRAIDVLGAAGLKIILGTPTATPPRWMVAKYPDMLAVDKDGHPRNFGSRRHYCFSHDGYRAESVAIAAKLGERYGRNPHIKAWQIDNEYGCHDTTLSYSDVARTAFRLWLEKRYGSVAALNEAWGNVFWSMDYNTFSEIDLPNLTVTEPNPSHLMDFRRFSSDQVVAFNQAQCEALRPLTDAPLIHNYMGRILDFDHFDVGADLDIASWDSYPLGFLEDRSDQGEEWKRQFMRQGDPDFQAFHHDLYRAVGQMRSREGRWWVMEQQPGPVNWAPTNPAPLPGMVRLWTWEAIAHGADVVSYFRWRQAPFAQEQMHAGLLRPDGEEAEVTEDILKLSNEIKGLDNISQQPSDIAIVFDYASAWAWDTQPQGQGFNYFRLIFDVYRALRKQGMSIDILPPTTGNFGDRTLVLIPGLFAWTPELKTAISTFGGQLLIGPRTGSKTKDFQIPNALPPEIPGMDIRVNAVETLRTDSPVPLENGGHLKIWREFLESSEKIIESSSDGRPALIRKNNITYLGGWPDDAAMDRIITDSLGQANIMTESLPEGVRCRDYGDQRLYINYNAKPVTHKDMTIAASDIKLVTL